MKTESNFKKKMGPLFFKFSFVSNKTIINRIRLVLLSRVHFISSSGQALYKKKILVLN